ncbi:uncharacterized protein TEOVI_000798200 [Trypanosoma equiperdum]|uniref:Uncharacterized protein n=2 Tax=Trypanozoon TaxID=39700 RepID=Q38DZ0_TRYB2|nr:hypothetical protein, conserved [Trypanosoma brucei brucei TREU927]EAN76980.1 hypothetical protein, conserved [Trypanosoma brucei brucei TREU927]SCU68635.1 hypothetical protein, conserved [Trypanosoma equiperdum]
MLHSSRIVLVALVKKQATTPTVKSDGAHAPSTERTGERVAVYTPTASEAPELLLPYVEPKPFVSTKRLKAFVASMFVGATTIGTAYYLLSKSISTSLEDGNKNLYLQRIIESNRVALQPRPNIVPEFTAPSSFAELQKKMQQHELELDRKRARILDETVMLHAEAGFRMKLWWNTCLAHIQEAGDKLAFLLQERRERAALAHIRESLDEKGYELVKLRCGKTHIW